METSQTNGQVQAALPAGAPIAGAAAMVPGGAVPERRVRTKPWRALRRNRKATVGALLLAFFVVLAVFPGDIAPYNPSNISFGQSLGPSAAHWLGTTSQGQDIYSQLIWGTRQSLIIALAAGGMATVLSVVVGVSAAYLGGLSDGFLSLFTDVLLVIPIFPLVIVIAAYLRSAGLWDMVIVLGALGWSYGARQLRVQVLSLRDRDFLKAATARGESKLYIIAKEVIPTMTSLIVATFLGSAVFAVLTAAGLQFVGLGDPEAQSWGTMLYWAQNNEALGAGLPLWAIMPGVCIALLGASFAFLNYAFDEISNPALRPVRRRGRPRGARVGRQRRAALPAGAPAARPLQRSEHPVEASAGSSAVPTGVAGTGAAPGAVPSGLATTRSGPQALLQVRNLSVEYPTAAGSVVAVDDVNLDLDRGEFLAVVGESGCGKSTLLFAVARLLNPPARVSGGSVLFGGREMASLSEKQLRHVRWREYSVVMQNAMNALNPVMTLREQMWDACRAHSTMSRQEITERSADVLRLVSIDPLHLDSYPHQLSGGMRQRSMIAMALLFTPDLVIMDEPTSALDVVAQRSLMRQIKELQQRLGFAVIFVTHDISLVSHFSDRLMVMYAGQVAELGVTSEVFGTPRHPYARALLDAFPSVRGKKIPLTGISGAPPDLASPPAGCRFQPRCADAMPECGSVRPPLYQAGEAAVRCLLYKDVGPGSGSVTGASAPTLRNGVPGVVAPAPVPERAAVGAAAVGAAAVGAAAVGAAAVEAAAVGAAVIGAAAVEAAVSASGDEPRPLVEVTGLTRHFALGGFGSRRKLHAVDDVSFTIAPREIVALVGESGSGKSTVARLLALLYKPTSGDVRFEGQPLSAVRGRAQERAYRGHVPMVFQDPYSSLNNTYRVSHGIMRAIALHRPDIGRSQRRAEALRVMEAVGLRPAEQMLSKYPYELSGGQRQRVGFAQALVLRPRLILADEPVSMLDVSIRVGLLNLMAELREREGVSFLYITHDLASARYVADRVIVMYAGHVVEVGPTEEVLAAPQHPYTKLLLSAAPDPRAPLDDSGASDAGEPPKVVDPAPGCRFQPRCPYAVAECLTVTPRLGAVAPGQFAACHVALAHARSAQSVAPA